MRKQVQEDLQIRKSKEQQTNEFDEFYSKKHVASQFSSSGKPDEQNTKTGHRDLEGKQEELLDDEPQDETEERERNSRLFRAAKDGDVQEVMLERRKNRALCD
jgi:hypothetical protein